LRGLGSPCCLSPSPFALLALLALLAPLALVALLRVLTFALLFYFVLLLRVLAFLRLLALVRLIRVLLLLPLLLLFLDLALQLQRAQQIATQRIASRPHAERLLEGLHRAARSLLGLGEIPGLQGLAPLAQTRRPNQTLAKRRQGGIASGGAFGIGLGGAMLPGLPCGERKVLQQARGRLVAITLLRSTQRRERPRSIPVAQEPHAVRKVRAAARGERNRPCQGADQQQRQSGHRSRGKVPGNEAPNDTRLSLLPRVAPA
jgi:hypothetical protein